MKPIMIYFKILKYQQQNIKLINKYFNVIELNNPNCNKDIHLNKAHVLSAPLGFNVDSEYMDKCPNLKVIVSNTTGVPHIDMEAARIRNISVCALHNEQEFLETITPTVEHTIGLMLASIRRIPSAHSFACSGNWDRRPWGSPRMLSRLRIGLIGYGRIGRRVCKISKSLGMKVSWFDPNINTNEEGCMNDIVELAENSDILSLHAVSNKNTYKLVNRRVLESLPYGATVINTARGELLDTDALIDLLESGHIWAAGLDTIDGEYEEDFSSIFNKSRIVEYAKNHDNLILTPHIGGSTIDAWYETERRVIEKSLSEFGINILNE
jgi:phosphoglycerate dehydrogenase-like enzyme